LFEHLRDGRGGLLPGKTPNDFIATPELMQNGSRHTPRFARCAVAARQGQRRQMTNSLKTIAINTQQFTAPGTAIGTQPDTVKRQRNHRSLHAMLGQHSRCVCVMMLHTKQLQTSLAGKISGETCRMKIRVQIVRHDRRLDFQQLHKLRNRLLEKAAGGGIVEVANML
jgi:hypothetical protein